MESEGNADLEQLASGHVHERLLTSEEKLPVTQGETVIVVTRTIKEQRVRQRRWYVFYSFSAALFVIWLLWALLQE